jgi:hypothetical protein
MLEAAAENLRINLHGGRDVECCVKLCLWPAAVAQACVPHAVCEC